MKSLFSTSLLATLGLAALIAAPVQAQTTVYNNLFDSMGVASYEKEDGWAFGGKFTIFGLGGSGGFAFRPSSSGNLFDVSLALTSGHLNSFSTVFLRESSPVPGVLTGNILESWTFMNVSSGIKTLTSVNNNFLDSSKSYFLYVDDEYEKIKAWHVNNQNDFDSNIQRNNVTGEYIPRDGYLKGAFRVRTTAMALTPEAPGLMQLLPGLLPVGLLIAKRRRLKKSV